MSSNRRNFLKKTAVGAIGIAAASISGMAHAANEVIIDAKSTVLNLGVASYSLRKFSLEESLDMVVRSGINRISLKSMHLPLDSDTATIKMAAALCKEKGVVLYGVGVIYMKSKAEVDQAFEYAKTAGAKTIIGVPNHALLDYVEHKVKEYDINFAIHNHGPGDKLYPSAESAYVRIKDRDKRMGLCIDIGHTKRINRNPEQDLEAYFERVFDIHLKDVTKAAGDGKTCIIGRGVINFPVFLKSVVSLGYKGTLALEYEAEADDPFPGVSESVGYVKGILSVL
jgi:inosose dehydratase